MIQTISQTFPSNTPSPNSYEFALHGLLALGSTPASHPGVDFPPDTIITPDQDVSTFDFAQGEDVNSVLDANNSRRGPETYQRESTHRPTLSFGSVSRDLPGLSPGFRKFDVTGGSHHSHEASILEEIRSSKASQAGFGATGSAIELLKTYRYNVAPWLDICDVDQHFGVELLTIARREPKVRTWVMRVAAATSSMAWLMEDLNADKAPSLEVASDATHPDLNVEAIVGVLDVLIDTFPELAANWGRQKDQDRPSQVTETLLLESGHSKMHACAYWLSVRLGMLHP